MNELRTAALDYSARGWTVMPVGSDKRPLLASWKSLQTERPSVEQITSWWAVWEDAGIAVLTGSCSGLCVLDIDGPDGLTALLAAGGSATVQTPTVRTGRGAHVYYQHDPTVGNRTGLLAHVDLKAAGGGYVIAPPSRHASGRVYEWKIPPTIPLAPVPAWLHALMTMAPSGNGCDGKQGQRGARQTTPSHGCIPQGGRHDHLWRLGRSRRFAGASAQAIEDMLRTENLERCDPPLAEWELAATIREVNTRADAPHILASRHNRPQL